MVPHGHREGHLIFHVQGPPGRSSSKGKAFPLSAGQAVAISPWQAHYYSPVTTEAPTLALVLYIRPGWFLEAARQRVRVAALRARRDRGDRHVRAGSSSRRRSEMLDPDRADPPARGPALRADPDGLRPVMAMDRRAARDFTGPELPRRDFRIRKALRLLQEQRRRGVQLDCVAREVGLSRPHFFKLFRTQVGLTPNLYLNALRMERAIERLAAGGRGRRRDRPRSRLLEPGELFAVLHRQRRRAALGLSPSASTSPERRFPTAGTRMRLSGICPRASPRARLLGSAGSAPHGRGDADGCRSFVTTPPGLVARSIAIVVAALLWLIFAPWPDGTRGGAWPQAHLPQRRLRRDHARARSISSSRRASR